MHMFLVRRADEEEGRRRLGALGRRRCIAGVGDSSSSSIGGTGQQLAVGLQHLQQDGSDCSTVVEGYPYAAGFEVPQIRAADLQCAEHVSHMSATYFQDRAGELPPTPPWIQPGTNCCSKDQFGGR